MNPCATREQLKRLVSGGLDRPERETVAVHVQDCAACQHVLDELTRVPHAAEVRDSDSLANTDDARLLERLNAKGPRAVDEDQPGKQPFKDAGSYQEGDQPAVDPKDSPRSSSIAPVLPAIVGFKIIREIGRGGMGVVYEAEEELLNRRVALKVLPSGALHHPKHVERFRREAKAAARLHHTHIVPVFGVGEQAGHPYYVMQYIDGRGLDDVLKELRLLRQDGSSPRPVAALRLPDGLAPPVARDEHDVHGPPSITPAEMAMSLASGRFEEPGSPASERQSTETGDSGTAIVAPPIVSANHSPVGATHGVLTGSSTLSSPSNLSRPYFQSVARIGLQVAEALEYANCQGVLHRDIKPSNLLLDTKGSVRVTDFGLAKTADSDDLTDTGDLVGTLRYMAPERFQGQCDIRSDVYSLGLTLYELVALRPAFEASDRHELIEKVLHEEPIRLNTLARRIPRDLDTIIRKAIAREPARRYATAAALADDLRRFLESRPIAARPVGAAERLWRWCRRNPKVASLSAAVFVSLLVGSAVSATLAIRAIRAEAETRQQRDRAVSEAANAKAVNEFLRTDLLAQASAYNQVRPGNRPDPDLKVRTALDRAAEKIGERFANQPVLEASIRQTIGDTYFQLGLFPQALSHLQRALTLRRQVLGNKHPDTLIAMDSLGAVYLSDGKLSEAEPLLVGAMEGLRLARGPEHPETLVAINGVAHLYHDQRKFSDAEGLLIQVRDGFLRLRGADDPETLDATNTLAMVYQAQGKSELAERMLLELLGAAPRKLGIDHPMTLNIKGNLADVYLSQGKMAEAGRLYEETMAAQSRILGREHPDTLVSMVKLGSLYTIGGELDKAESLLLEALNGCRKALDRNHEATDAALAGLAAIYSTKKDMNRLGLTLIEAAEITRYRWGVDSDSSLSANQAAGMFLLVSREFAKAEPYLRDCLKHWDNLDPGHGRGEHSFSEVRLGTCLLAQRKFGEAEPLLLAAYHGLKPRGQNMRPLDQAEVGWLIVQLKNLRDQEGRPLNDVSLRVLRSDPGLQGIVFDRQFPALPFAPP
jgi:eukaryotic-like serine/threonine-protein kinase